MNIQKNQNLIPIITKVHYQFAENISSINTGSSKNTRQIVFNPDQDWEQIEISPASVKFQEPMSSTNAGPMYKQSLNFTLQGEDTGTIDDYDQLIGRRIILRLEYNTGLLKIVGSLDNPARFNDSPVSDEKGTRNQIEFFRKSSYRAFILEEI